MQWEYLSVCLDVSAEDYIEEMDIFGFDEWELVSTYFCPTCDSKMSVKHLFKRPLIVEDNKALEENILVELAPSNLVEMHN